MKKHFRKLFTALVFAVCAVCFALGFAACNDNGGGGGGNKQPIPLEKPVVTLVGNVLSWGEVAHADGYEIYLEDTKETDTTETTYTINKTALGAYVYKVKAISSNEKYTDSQFSDTVRFVKTEPLTAPEIALKNGVITWEAVPHATGYNIYENGEYLQVVAQPTYSITKKAAAGDYVYTVKAISAYEVYTESQESNEETFTVTALAAPELSVDGNAILHWNEVPDAERYVIYADGYPIEETEEFSYVIDQDPGAIEYKVVACNQSIDFADTESEPCIYDAPLITEITVEIPQGFTGQNVKVVFNNNNVTAAPVEKEITDFTAPLRVVLPVGDYTVELKGLPLNYVSTWATVSAETRVRTAKLTVLEKTDENTLKVNEDNRLQVTFGSQATVTKEYIFVAGATDAGDGVHTVTAMDAPSSGKYVRVYAENVKIIDTSLEVEEAPDIVFNKGNFTLDQGKTIILTFEFEASEQGQVEFNIRIDGHEEKQYLEVGEEIYDKNNYIIDSATRYIKVNQTQKLTIMFSYPRFGRNTVVTLKIDGKEYTVDGNSSGYMLNEELERFKYCADESCGVKVDFDKETCPECGGSEFYTKYCTVCGTKVAENAEECPNCGKLKECLGCGAKVPESVDECPNCKTCAECGAVMAATRTECTQCGSHEFKQSFKLLENIFKYYEHCSTCGTELENQEDYCENCGNYSKLAYIEFEADKDVKIEITVSGGLSSLNPVLMFWVFPPQY